MCQVESSFGRGQTELPDDELVLAIIAGEADYKTLRERAPDRITAARVFASVASARFAAGGSGSACDVCGLPGSQTTMTWSARFLGREHLIESLILFPIVLLTIVFGGILPESKARAAGATFRTRHILCGKCRPGLAKRLGVDLLNGCVCLLMLAAFGIFLFSAGVLVCYLAGVWDMEKDLAVAVIPWFVLSLAFMLSHLSRWPRRIARAIALPRELRGMASGPFELHLDSASRPTVAET